MFEPVFIGAHSHAKPFQISSIFKRDFKIVIRLSARLFDKNDIKTLPTMLPTMLFSASVAGNHLDIRTVYWLYCSCSLAFKDSNQHIRIGVCEITLITIKVAISSIVIGLISLFSTNILAKLLSDSLLLDSSISQSHSTQQFKSTKHIQSCSLN